MLDGKISTQKKSSSKFRSMTGIAGLFFVFMAVFFVNQKTTSDLAEGQFNMSSINDPQLHRNIANFGGIDLSWQKKLASRLAELNDVPAGKSARHPSAIENFLFGELKGYYLMELKGNKVREMTLKQKDAEDLPHYLGEELSFLEKNRTLWWVGFNQTSLKLKTKDKSIVSLLDENQKIVGEASFVWDEAGRMISLKLEKQ